MKQLLSLILVLMLAACALAEAAPWTREGTFADEGGNYLSIFHSEDPDDPGFYVSLALGDTLYYGTLPQEGDALRGSLDSDSGVCNVTIAGEGADGLLLTLENGNACHFSPMEIPQASIVVTANTDGLGQIAYAEGTEAPAFDDDAPTQSVYLGLAEPATYTFSARADEGYKFVNWKKAGEVLSDEPQITLELTESMDLVAVFKEHNPFAPEPVSDIGEARTLGDILGLPGYGYSASENAFVTAVELNGIVYRVTANLDPKTAEAFLSLNFDDPDYQKKFIDLLSPMAIEKVENLTEQKPSQEVLDALAGRTGADLLNDGWTCVGWSLDDMTCEMYHGPFDFTVVFEGEVRDKDAFEEDDIRLLKVVSVTCNGIGDPTAE